MNFETGSIIGVKAFDDTSKDFFSSTIMTEDIALIDNSKDIVDQEHLNISSRVGLCAKIRVE